LSQKRRDDKTQLWKSLMRQVEPAFHRDFMRTYRGFIFPA
jgi:hypothetical protein